MTPLSPLGETALRRLSLIKQLLLEAKRRGEARGGVSSLALLSLHDAAEWFLRLVADELNVSVKTDVAFMAYFNEIEQKKGVTLTHKGAMDELDRARGNLKHKAILVAPEKVRELVTRTHDFVADNCRTILGTSFEEVSLAWLIPYADVRDSLKAAEEAFSRGDSREALCQAAIAFEQLVRRRQQVVWQLNERPSSSSRDAFDIQRGIQRAARSAGRVDRPRSDPFLLRALQDFSREVQTRLVSQDRKIEMLASGIPYDRFRRFKRIAPEVYGSKDGLQCHWRPQADPSADNAEFCISFVIEASLAFHESAGELMEAADNDEQPA